MTDKIATYLIPKSPVCCEQIIKQSRFICHIGHAGSRDHVLARCAELSTDHPKANHVCWAYICGAPGSPERGMSDDGEPKGTAGRPMLTVLEYSGYGEIWVAVVRYFGGIKLGKGGLIRAYTSSVQQALAMVESEKIQPMLQFRLCLDYNHLPLCESLLNESECLGVLVIERIFTDKVELILRLPESEHDSFTKKITAITSGKARFETY